MHVLCVDEEVPFPLNTGKRLRTYNLLKRLQEGHRVTFLCYGTGNEELPDCPHVKLVVLRSPLLEQKGGLFYLSLLRNVVSPLPYVVVRHYSHAMRSATEALLAHGDIDLIHCEWTPYTENVRHVLGRVPSVLSAHNVEAQIWERYYRTERNPVKKGYIYLQWQKMLDYERQASRLYGEVAVVSEPDRRVFEDDYGCRRVMVVENGVDERYFEPQDVLVKPNSMVFTGSMDWRPNQDGVRYFIEEIFPAVKRTLPDATFTVVGRNPPRWLADLAHSCPGVAVTGTVDDVRPFIAESALYVVPLRVGGGSRLKILEALSMEKPVLSTTIGAEGLAVEDGTHLLVRDGTEPFAAAAVEMLTRPHRFGQLGASGRGLIMRHYTWDALAVKMARVWQKAVTSYHV